MNTTSFTSGLICVKCRGVFQGAKYFAYLSRSFLWKGKKMNCITKSNHLLTPNSRATSLCYSGVIRVKMFVLKHWVFLEDIWNFNKWKSLMIDEKCWMLWRAMLRETVICYQSNKFGKCRWEKLYFFEKNMG